MKILVVDDSATVRMFYRSALAAFPAGIDEAPDGEKALAMALTQDYGLYIVDVNMSNMDGLTFVRALRARHDVMQSPVIMISTQSREQDATLAWQAGANLYLKKPVAKETLQYYVSAMTSRRAKDEQ